MNSLSPTEPRCRFDRAFTALELVIVIGAIVLVAGMLLPALRPAHGSHCGISCIFNLKQIGTGLRMYANDYDSKYPAFNSTNEAWQYFQAAGDQFSSPKVLLCPEDRERPKAPRASLDFTMPPSTNSFGDPRHQNNSLSYFYAADASIESSQMWLAGDRNLAMNEHLLTGRTKAGPYSSLSWTPALHKNKGNIGFVDGSVREMDTARLRKALAAGTNETQRLILP